MLHFKGGIDTIWGAEAKVKLEILKMTVRANFFLRVA